MEMSTYAGARGAMWYLAFWRVWVDAALAWLAYGLARMRDTIDHSTPVSKCVSESDAGSQRAGYDKMSPNTRDRTK